MTIVLAILAIAVLGGLVFVVLYNGLVGKRNRCDEAWAGIDVQLRRRHDLIPNLVETVRTYAAHERGIFEAVTAARAAAVAAPADPTPAKLAAENALTIALGQVRAVAEEYPDLKASEQFGKLQAQLVETEDQIQAARRIYNGNVQAYQTAKQQIPGSLVAGVGNFPDRAYFQVETDAERDPVAVRLS